jgi:hypothetical protein
MRRSHNVTREALQQVRNLLGEIDDVIYRDARSRGPEDYTLSEEEVVLTTIVDEALGQTTKMIEAAV